MINKFLFSGKKKKEAKGKKPAKGEAKAQKSSGRVDNSSGQSGPKTIKDLFKPSPTFQETPHNGRVRLFIEKLRLCSVMFDWDKDENNMGDNARGIEIKRQLLLELVDQVGKAKAAFSEHVVFEIMKMVRINLFRTLPPKVHEDMIDPEEEEPVFEPAWPHLQIVYEFFLRFIVSGDLDVRLMRKHITVNFVNNFLLLFDSEDPRERDYLKTILHRIYAKFMMLRAFIRKSIKATFSNFIYETECHNGIAELLEILGSIINGFALPLKHEHKAFYKNVLIPMHKVKPLHVFHRQLSYCVTQFVDKDHTLSTDIVEGMLKFWPVLNSSKELLFLNELEEILEMTQPEQFEGFLGSLFKRVAQGISSPHFQIAERALFLWHNEYISSLIADYRKEVLPIIFPALHGVSQSHWNQTVSSLTLSVLKIFVDLDTDLVEKCSKIHTDSLAAQEKRLQKREEDWKYLTSLK